jgi:hypothetical protein
MLPLHFLLKYLWRFKSSKTQQPRTDKQIGNICWEVGSSDNKPRTFRTKNKKTKLHNNIWKSFPVRAIKTSKI